MAVGLDVFKAILSRMLFATHSLVTIYWVTETTENPKLWFLAVILVALAIETVQCVIFRRGQENKWVSFSILCYLTTIIPCAWLMELHLLNQRIDPSTTLSSPLKIDKRNFTDLILQTTLLILILGRWLLPKGSLSRESLSQLLLVNLAMSADIIEFFDILKLEQARKSRDLVLTILSLWTISLLQFPLTGTAKLDDRKDEVEPGVTNNDKTSISGNHTKQGRRQPRVSVDTSLLQAPLSDRKMSIIDPQPRRSSMLQMLGTSESDDVLSVLPDTKMKTINLKRNSVAVTSNGHNSLSRDRSPRRLSFDVNKVRNSNFAESTSEDFNLSNKIPRRCSRDVQTSSHASMDTTADRFTARANFERLGSLESAESTVDDDKPKHRVTMDLIGTTMALFLQDGPFLTFRLYVIAQYSAFQYMIIFLTVKNALLVVLQIYKITVQHCVCHDHKDNDFSPENPVDATSRLNNVQIAVIHERTGTKKSGTKVRRGRYNRFSVRWTRTKTRITQSGPLFQEKIS